MSIPKKVRTWYRTYRARRLELGEAVYSFTVWAQMEFAVSEGGRRKLLAHALRRKKR